MSDDTFEFCNDLPTLTRVVSQRNTKHFKELDKIEHVIRLLPRDNDLFKHIIDAVDKLKLEMIKTAYYSERADNLAGRKENIIQDLRHEIRLLESKNIK